MTHSPTSERNRAITQAQIDYERDKARNGGAEPKTGPHVLPDGWPPPLTEDAIKQSAVTWGAAGRAIAIAAALLVGAVAVGGWLDGKRCAAVSAHDSNAAAHADIRATQRSRATSVDRQLSGIRKGQRAMDEKLDALLLRRASKP